MNFGRLVGSLKTTGWLVAISTLLVLGCSASQKEVPEAIDGNKNPWGEQIETTFIPQENTAEQRSKAIEERNAYLQNPAGQINQVLLAIKEIEAQVDDGKIELYNLNDLSLGSRAREEEFMRSRLSGGVKVTQAPPYLQKILEIVIKNHPAADKAKAYQFKLLVCHGLESDCRGTFALSHGMISISLETLAFTESEAEIAAVFGHEVTHVVNEDTRHTLTVYGALGKRRLNELAIGEAYRRIPETESLKFKQET
ncbi:MAG: M48 family metalloprotease, partial [bacterium]|nr:M48 family metalloprotease [bacterium]